MRIAGVALVRPSLRIVGLVLIAILASGYFLADAAKALIAKPRLPEMDSAQLEILELEDASPPQGAELFSVIIKRNIFKAAMPEAKQVTSIANLPVAQLSVKLLGTIHCDLAPFSRAIVLEGDKQRLVKVGGTLDDYTIVEIQRRALVLSKGRQKKVLLIDVAGSERVDDMRGEI